MKVIESKIVYDNCKACKNKCEHAGKDREFICPDGVSCKVTYSKEDIKKAASVFVSAIKEISKKPENLDNLESYLSHHFPEWLKKYASDPESMAEELKSFAEMDI